MKKYNIVEKGLENFVLASCYSKELADTYLKDMIENDLKLQKYYNLERLPDYIIIESEVI